MATINGTTTNSLSKITTGDAPNLGPYFSPFASKPVSQIMPNPIPKSLVPKGVAMPLNRSPVKILNKIRSNSSTTQLQAEKQARDCVKEVVNGTGSHKNAITVLLKIQQTFAAFKKTTTTTSIELTNSAQGLAPPKPKTVFARAKKHKQAKNQTDGNASLPTTLASFNNMHSATQTKPIAPITSTELTTPAKPIKPPRPSKTKSESKAARPSKSTADSKTINLTMNKSASNTSTPAKSTPGSRTATSAKSAFDPKTSKPFNSV